MFLKLLFYYSITRRKSCCGKKNTNLYFFMFEYGIFRFSLFYFYLFHLNIYLPESQESDGGANK